MNCDRCSKPSCGPRCPICRATYGDAPISNPQFRVEPPTAAQKTADRRYGWSDSEDDDR